MTATQARPRIATRIVLGLIYIAAGIIHLRSPGGFIAITPPWVPFAPEVVALTGIAEIAGGFALIFVPGLRRAAGIGLALYALCVFPANINHAINDIAISGIRLPWAYHAPRLALQPVIIWWALWASGVIDWPFTSRR